MKIDHEAVMERLRAKMKAQFPINCRVRMTAEAAAMFPRYREIKGTVVRHKYGGITPSVLWDGRKTESSYHPDYLRRIRS